MNAGRRANASSSPHNQSSGGSAQAFFSASIFKLLAFPATGGIEAGSAGDVAGCCHKCLVLLTMTALVSLVGAVVVRVHGMFAATALLIDHVSQHIGACLF